MYQILLVFVEILLIEHIRIRLCEGKRFGLKLVWEMLY